MKIPLLAVLFGAAIVVSGCSTVRKSDTVALQGTWRGYDKAQPSAKYVHNPRRW